MCAMRRSRYWGRVDLADCTTAIGTLHRSVRSLTTIQERSKTNTINRSETSPNRIIVNVDCGIYCGVEIR